MPILGTMLVAFAFAALALAGPATSGTAPATIRSEARHFDQTSDDEASWSSYEGFLGVRALPDASGQQALFLGDGPGGVQTTDHGVDVLDGIELQRARIQIDEVIELSNTVAPIPAAATDIGPGSFLIITIPGEGTFGCTANYVWESGSTLYLGAAGHCFLPASERATHGESPASSNYDASGVTVKVCIWGCTYGGQSGFIFQGALKKLGDVAYARQTDSGGDVGNDFGIVTIPSSLHSLVRTQMPVWGGPSSEGMIGGYTPVVHYGSGMGLGEHYSTQARAGFSLLYTGTSYFAAEMAGSPGDSGSAVNTAKVSGTDLLVGDKAGGILTHIVLGLEVVAGTQLAKAKAMTSGDAGISISVKT